MDDAQLVFNPIMHVLEVLGETTVRRVSFANCHLSYAEDCILEDAVGSSDITHLELSDNPHGEQGLRCLVRLLARKRDSEAQIESLSISSVWHSPLPPDGLKYDSVDPTATYRLLLRLPHHRSVLRLLLKRGEECGGNLFACFVEERLDGQNVPDGLRSLCSKRADRGGDDWIVPMDGILSFTFQLPPCFSPRDDLRTVFCQFERKQKIRVDFGGFARLLRLYGSLPDEKSRLIALCAMSRDLVLKICHLRHLLQFSKELFVFVVMTLLPTVKEQTSRTVLFELIESCAARGTPQLALQAKAEAHNLLYFNAMHPDGHYSLQLQNLVDRGTAQRCMVISNWVRHQTTAIGHPDLSEQGNGDCLRHTYLRRQRFAFDSVAWQLPDDGTFEFDVVLPRMTLKADEALDDVAGRELVSTLLNSPCNYKDRLCALRLVAHRILLLPEGLSEMLQIFPTRLSKYVVGEFDPRVEAFILLYNRTLYHSKVLCPQLLYNPELFQPAAVQKIRKRLGWIHTFDPINLHSDRSNLGTRHGPLDLSTHDGWLVTKAMIAISLTEAYLNFDNCFWSEKAALYERGYAFFMPKEWLPNPAHVGEFTCSWVSIPHEINYVKRREIAASLLGWTYAPRGERGSRRGSMALLGKWQAAGQFAGNALANQSNQP